MFDSVFYFLQRFFTGFLDHLLNWGATLWDTWGKTLTPWIAALIVIMGWVLWALGFVKELVTKTLGSLTNLAALTANLDVQTVTSNDWFQFINTFFPLAELFAALVLYGSIAMLVIVIRLVVQLYKLIPFKMS